MSYRWQDYNEFDVDDDEEEIEAKMAMMQLMCETSDYVDDERR